MASKHRVTVGEELRYDSDVQGLKNLNGTYGRKATYTPDEFGAVGDGITDDTAALQQWINTVLAASATGVSMRRVYKITAPLIMGSAASFKWKIDGGGSTIRQATDNTPILKFTKEGTSQFRLEGFQLDYVNQQPSTNTNAVAILFDSDTNLNFGFFNFEIGNIAIDKGFRGICLNEASANNNPVWGCDFHHIRVGLFQTGAMIRLVQTVSGQPNAVFRQLYARCDSMVETVMTLTGYHGVKIDGVELNNSNRPVELSLNTCEAAIIDNYRTESGTISVDFSGIITLSDVRASIRGIEVQSKTFTNSNWAYVVRGISANTQFTLQNATVSNISLPNGAQVALIQGNDMGSFEFGGVFRNASSITGVYQFDNTPQKQIRYQNDFSQQGVVQRYVSGAGKITVADSDFPVTPKNGTLAVALNTTDSTVRLFARANGTWKSVTLA